MKATIKYLLTTVFFCFGILSCSKDNEEVNLPPEEVTNIQATLISGTMVRITWNAAVDQNKDEIKYEVVVNEKIITKDITENSVELDIEEFIPNNFENGSGKSVKNGTKAFTGKIGLDVVLGIEIKAYDSMGGFSSESVIKKISINRAPEEFSFSNIYIDVESFSYLEVTWTPAIDKDGDKVTYNVYLNDIEIINDYSIQPNFQFGSAYYYSDYSNLADGEIIVKVVAKDSSGKIRELSQAFEFKATDLDLGTLQLPYNDNLSFVIPKDEPDDRIGIKFTIQEEQGYRFSIEPDNIYMRLRDTNNINYNFGSPTINGGGLPAGTYYLDVYNNIDSNVNGNLSILLKDATEGDTNLGILQTPAEGIINYDLSGEIDQRINYFFQIEENSGYTFISSEYLDMVLYDSNNNSTNSYSYNSILKGADLAPGEYRLEIYSYYPTQPGQINFEFKNAILSDVNLGVLESNTSNEVSFIFDNEPDDKIAYDFQITETTGYAIYTSSEIQFSLLDANGFLINGFGYKRLNGTNLLPGTYRLELNSQSQLSGAIYLDFKDSSSDNVNLGILQTPYGASFDVSFDISSIDDTIVYFIETESVTNYNFSMSNGIYIELKDLNSNFINSGYSNFSGQSLPAGKYRVEVKPTDYYYTNGAINGSISMQFITF